MCVGNSIGSLNRIKEDPGLFLNICDRDGDLVNSSDYCLMDMCKSTDRLLNFNILHLNIRSALKHRDDLTSLISRLKDKVM